MYFNARDFDYNIESLLNDYYKYIKQSKSYKLENKDSFFYAKNINEDNKSCENGISDKPSGEEESIETELSLSDMMLNESELMHRLYSDINLTLMPFVNEILDSYEYNSSPMYAKEGLDRELISQMTDQVLIMAADGNDNPDEVFSENFEINNVFTPWSRWMLMRAAAEGIILNEIFGVRRPKRFLSL